MALTIPMTIPAAAFDSKPRRQHRLVWMVIMIISAVYSGQPPGIELTLTSETKPR